jgi:hypothetical protein
MISEEQQLSVLKNFTLKEMFSAYGQDFENNLSSEGDANDASFHSTQELVS